MLFIFSACSSNDESSTAKADLHQIKSVNGMQSYEEQRIAFSMLSNKEKYELWKEKLENLLRDENWNTNQKNIVNELLTKLKPESYDKVNSRYHDYFTTIYIKDFINRAKSIFNQQQVVSYFYKIPRAYLGYQSPGVLNECTCLTSEMIHWDCGVFNLERCKKSSCREVDGCGALNTSFCNGKCFN